MTDYRLHPITWQNVIDYNWLRLHHVSLPVDTGRCRFTHTRHTFQWRLMTCRWDNANFNMKHISSGYQANFSHDLQAERNEQLTSHSYPFCAGWGKMPLFLPSHYYQNNFKLLNFNFFRVSKIQWKQFVGLCKTQQALKI